MQTRNLEPDYQAFSLFAIVLALLTLLTKARWLHLPTHITNLETSIEKASRSNSFYRCQLIMQGRHSLARHCTSDTEELPPERDSDFGTNSPEYYADYFVAPTGCHPDRNHEIISSRLGQGKITLKRSICILVEAFYDL